MERLDNASSKDGRMVPSTSSKVDLNVVTPLVTAEKEQVSFFCREGSLFVHVLPNLLSEASGSFCIFCIYFLFNFVLFSFYLSLLIPSDIPVWFLLLVEMETVSVSFRNFSQINFYWFSFYTAFLVLRLVDFKNDSH